MMSCKKSQLFRKQLVERMHADHHRTELEMVDSIDPIPYREQFNPTFLFHLDILVDLERQIGNGNTEMSTELRDIWIKCYRRYHLYVCILTSMGDRILIFLYRVRDDVVQNDASELCKEMLIPESTKLLFHRVHDATEEIRQATRKHWVSKENGYFLNMS
jgi:hypothetical protein